ncbi:hypothetical protein ABT256_38265 [Amycolatopsis japonica]|uniref:hypothetical protein n=1 Tax=Amycolatopsis japonica TaxID=208439 RepID=UPI003325124B
MRNGLEVTLVSEFGKHDRDAVSARPRGSLRGFADTVGLASARVWRLRGRAWNTLRHPAGWELWRLPPAAVFWMLGTEIAVAFWALKSQVGASLTTTDLVRFGVIAGCTIWYLVQTQHPEDRRNSAGPTTGVASTSTRPPSGWAARPSCCRPRCRSRCC